jgi:hypothetical protein
VAPCAVDSSDVALLQQDSSSTDGGCIASEKHTLQHHSNMACSNSTTSACRCNISNSRQKDWHTFGEHIMQSDARHLQETLHGTEQKMP